MSILELDLKLCQAIERKELEIKRLKKKHLATVTDEDVGPDSNITITLL